MQPDKLILGHPYLFYGADGQYRQVLFHAMRLSADRATVYVFRTDRFNTVDLNAMQVSQLISEHVTTQQS